MPAEVQDWPEFQKIGAVLRQSVQFERRAADLVLSTAGEDGGAAVRWGESRGSPPTASSWRTPRQRGRRRRGGRRGGGRGSEGDSEEGSDALTEECCAWPLASRRIRGRLAMDLAPSLPDDALADVLRRLAPRGLAASRCVCKSWRRVVDERRLLRADLLPLSLGGIFLNFHDLDFTQFLNRPTAGATVSGRLDYTCHASEPGCYPRPRALMYGHCNGLLLLDHCVVNPATRQWALLPSPPEEMLQPPPPGMDFRTYKYLVFDPTLSPNYFEVFILPDVPYKLKGCEEVEWPQCTLILPVFSSKTGWWEERTFSREGEAAGTLPRMVHSPRLHHDSLSAYWQGALYIYVAPTVLF